ncbi:hypothetical protein FACS1894207_4760 [Bacteroidia bacterium]|nr:hypothetical protein FACS1894207_4760 [Bacteroidia bacterium]
MSKKQKKEQSREQQNPKQNQQPNKEQPSKDEKPVSRRSEEIVDIVDRMPVSFGKWVAMAVCVFAGLLLLFGWIIKYPDTVTGHIKINSNNAPVKLVANVSGIIHQIAFQAQEEVKKGDYIAVVENSAQTDDVRKIADLMFGNPPNSRKNREYFNELLNFGTLAA